MIWDSLPWKKELHKNAILLNDLKLIIRWQQITSVKLEKVLFYSFYIIRKLLEAQKLSSDIENGSFLVNKYNANGKNITLMNWHNIDKLYDLSKHDTINKDIKWICNRFIHSYVFIECFVDNHLASVYVATDHDRLECVYSIDIDTLIYILESIHSDYITESHSYYDPKINDYRYIIKKR